MAKVGARRLLMLAIGAVLVVGGVWLFRSNSSSDPTPSSAPRQPGTTASTQLEPISPTTSRDIKMNTMYLCNYRGDLSRFRPRINGTMSTDNIQTF